MDPGSRQQPAHQRACVAAVLDKLGVHSRREAAAAAQELGVDT
jgi:DNA-binding NarL/FixJ family response regulator